ncbi:hypothetical protein U0070_003034, partial [Myodes glareolus]
MTLQSCTAAARGLGLALQLRPAPRFDALVKYRSDCAVTGRIFHDLKLFVCSVSVFPLLNEMK